MEFKIYVSADISDIFKLNLLDVVHSTAGGDDSSLVDECSYFLLVPVVQATQILMLGCWQQQVTRQSPGMVAFCMKFIAFSERCVALHNLDNR